MQASSMDMMSYAVFGVEEIPYPAEKIRWAEWQKPDDFKPNEGILGKVMMVARRVFEENRLAKIDRNRTSGRLNTRVLGRRAPIGDPRLFGKKTLPKKKSYHVVIGADCSGSTRSGDRISQIKKAVFAQAEMMTRLGIDWCGFGHTAESATYADLGADSYFNEHRLYTYILPFKKPEEQWNTSTKQKLANLVGISGNLDGHTLEYYRKQAQKSTATNRIIMYYTDGEMPNANYDEELEILQRELALCKREGITTIGVGIGTDSPRQHGMDTVRIDSDQDLHLVVEFLEKYLT
jgi:hypothetical protein